MDFDALNLLLFVVRVVYDPLVDEGVVLEPMANLRTNRTQQFRLTILFQVVYELQVLLIVEHLGVLTICPPHWVSDQTRKSTALVVFYLQSVPTPKKLLVVRLVKGLVAVEQLHHDFVHLSQTHQEH